MSDAEPLHVCKQVESADENAIPGHVVVECSCGWRSVPCHPSAYHWVVFVHRRAQ